MCHTYCAVLDYKTSQFIIPTLVIHHSFSLSLQTQNLPFQQILPTVDLFLPTGLPHDNGTGPDLLCSSFYFKFHILIFCLFRVVD